MRKDRLFIGGVLAVLLGAMLFASQADSSDRRKETEGRMFFTRNNIWYQHPQKIMSVGYHAGSILPLGTQVTVTKVRKNVIRFRVASGGDYQILFLPKFGSRGETIWDYFDKNFAGEDPTKGDFERMSADEQKMIRAGEILAGMGKWSVLRAYGYPPGNKTPSWEGDTWIYYVTKRATRVVTFKDGRVAGIK